MGGGPSNSSPFAPAPNPYAPSAPIPFEPKVPSALRGPITNQRPSMEEIMGHAWEVWKSNLGLLVGTTLVVFAISWAIALPLGFVQAAIEANGEKEVAAIVGGLGNIVAQLVQIFLGIGQAQIALKLARSENAEFVDLFNGGPRFLWVLLVSLLFGAAVFAGVLACVVPGIIVAMILWPVYWLVVDDRAGVLKSFSVAHEITQGNLGTVFVLGLVSFGINLLGIFALCVGILFAAPLVTMIWATAYLMMSGQLHLRQPTLPNVYAK